MKRLVSVVMSVTSLWFVACKDGGAIASAQTAPAKEAKGSEIARAKDAATGVPLDHHILVDQFGYRPEDPKVAVIRDPVAGFDREDKFVPGMAYEVRRSDDGKVVFSAKLDSWNGGMTEGSSGDRGWWFNFSVVTAPGSYFIYDSEKNRRSPIFSIDPHVYKKVLKAATRMFFYQRSGFAKRPPFADACWVDGPAYVGPGQDTEARDITDPSNQSKIRDLSGGWFDAGDTNKYVTNATQAVHQLLTAYEESPGAFTDDFDIPESGNGIPDVLDEVKWEIDWLKKMQYPDGSVALKVGETEYVPASPPSSDHSSRYYVPACTSSTIVAAGMFAHASYVDGQFPALASEAADLKARAIKSWNSYTGAPVKQTHCDSGVVHVGGADLSVADQDAEASVAAIYLYAITGGKVYQDYLKAHYHDLKPYHDVGWSRYKPHQGESLLFYTTLANADPELKLNILKDKLSDVHQGNMIYGFAPNDDLYRAYLHDAQYHWGSNFVRACYGTTNADVVSYNLDNANAATYETRALEILHYFHGVNPFGMVYLTNMYSLGATLSANEIYHSWFQSGTKWSDAKLSPCGPPPGYVPAGPNANATQNGVPASISPPSGQPPQKSYKDWNANWPESSWTITEPGIYYQAAYVSLVSKFVK